MINTGLDRKYTARAGGQTNFDPLPDGSYTLKVKEIDPWKMSKKTIQVIQRDENGNAIKDEKGKNVTETVNDCEFYNCNVKFEVVDEGQFKGRLVFHNLTTHPNMSWSIDNFLYGVGIEDCSAGEIPTRCIGAMCYAEVYTDSYEKTVQNKETGIDEVVERKINRVKSLKPLDTPKTNNVNVDLTDIDLGI